MTPEKRAKLILELLAFELEGVQALDLRNLEYAIVAQIHEALRDQMCAFNKTIVNPARSQGAKKRH